MAKCNQLTYLPFKGLNLLKEKIPKSILNILTTAAVKVTVRYNEREREMVSSWYNKP